MADRTVKVSLLADVRGFAAGMAQAQAATGQLSNRFKQESTVVGQGLTAIGVAAGLGVGAAVAKFADFDQQMSFVQASTHETAANMDLLRDAALDAGAKTVFSAQESANAIEELAKAGISTADILGGGLSGALDLAAAGGLGVADAAGIAATALTQFKLSGDDVPHVADLLAAGAGKAQGSVTDLSAALNQGGLVAAQTGLSLEETVGTLSAFASAGLLGSDAGTSFKTMLQSLTPSSDEARAKMDELGISAYDAQGNFVGMEKFAGILRSGLKDLSVEQQNAAMKTIFGADAVRAASIVFQEGADGIGDWIGKVDDSGYAAETAAMRLDNLKGDVEQLGGAFDTAFIKSGSGANDVLRLLVQSATELVTGFTELPTFVQQTAFGLGALAAAAALAGGAFFLGAPKLVEFGDALKVLSTSQIPGVASAATGLISATSKAGTALAATANFLTGPWGVALAAASIGVSELSKYLKSLQATSDEITNSLTSATSAATIFETASKGRDLTAWQDVRAQLEDLPSVLAASAEQSENLFARFDSSKFGAFDALRDIGTELGKLASTDLPAAQSAFRTLSNEYDLNERDQWRLLSTMDDYKQALIAQATELGINVTSSDEAANKQALLDLAFGSTTKSAELQTGQLESLAGQSNDTEGAINDLADAISNFGKAQFDTNAAQRDFEQAIDDANAKLEEQRDDFLEPQRQAYEDANGSLDGFVGTLEGFNATLDIGTQAGRDNQAALDGIAQAANTSAAAILSQTGSVDLSNEALARGKQALIDQLAQFGITGAAADVYVDKLLATPSDIETQAILLGIEESTARFEDWFNNLDGRVATVVVRAQLPDLDGAAVSGSGRMGTYAYGGYTGPGGKFDAAGIVHRNEFVSTSETLAHPSNRAALEFMHAGGVMPMSLGGTPPGGRSFATASTSMATMSVSPMVSLAGATLVMSIDGRQMNAVIQEQIIAADRGSSATADAGWRRDV